MDLKILATSRADSKAVMGAWFWLKMMISNTRKKGLTSRYCGGALLVKMHDVLP